MGIERVRSRWTEGKEREMGARGRGGRGLKEMNKERYRWPSNYQRKKHNCKRLLRNRKRLQKKKRNRESRAI